MNKNAVTIAGATVVGVTLVLTGSIWVAGLVGAAHYAAHTFAEAK